MEYFLNYTHLVKSICEDKTWKVIRWTFFLSHSSGPIGFVIASLGFVSVQHATLASSDLASQCVKQSSSHSRSVGKRENMLPTEKCFKCCFLFILCGKADKNGAVAASKQIYLAADVFFFSKKLLSSVFLKTVHPISLPVKEADRLWNVMEF